MDKEPEKLSTQDKLAIGVVVGVLLLVWLGHFDFGLAGYPPVVNWFVALGQQH